MRKIEVRLYGPPERVVGTLVETQGSIAFEYAPEFIADPLPLSPFRLAVTSGVRTHTNRDFAEVFGLFNDSLPDGWGLLLMDRSLRQRGINPSQLSVLDRLSYVGTHGMGALTYHPADPFTLSRRVPINLAEMAEQSAQILEGSAEEVLPALQIAGGSPMGARPKILVGVGPGDYMVSGVSSLPEGYAHYLVKFLSRDDPNDFGAVELAYARMAEAAQIAMPSARLFTLPDGQRFFGVQRFDRQAEKRIHVHTLSGLLEANYRLPSVDYGTFLKATLQLTCDQNQAAEAFRRMAFNVLAHNRDDHAKNMAYCMSPEGNWRLSPAYDLVFSEGPKGEHTMDIAGEGKHPTVSDMLRVAREVNLDPTQARQIIEEVQNAVSRWIDFAKEAEVSTATIKMIGDRINNVRTR